MSTVDELTRFVRDKLLDPDADVELTADAPLVGVVVDSVGLHELIAHIESTYEVEIDDAEVLPENFGSLRAAADLVERKRAAEGGDA